MNKTGTDVQPRYKLSSFLYQQNKDKRATLSNHTRCDRIPRGCSDNNTMVKEEKKRERRCSSSNHERSQVSASEFNAFGSKTSYTMPLLTSRKKEHGISLKRNSQ